jgi:hypothetical protein
MNPYAVPNLFCDRQDLRSNTIIVWYVGINVQNQRRIWAMSTRTWKRTLRLGFKAPSMTSTKLDEAVLAAVGAVSNHLRQSEAVKNYIASVPKGPGTNCPDSPVGDLVQYVEMQKAPIDKRDPALNLVFLRTYIMPVFEFERAEALRAIDACADASPFERELCAAGAKLGTLYDHVWAKWFSRVADPYQRLDAKGKAEYEATVKGTLAPLFDYTVFDYRPTIGIYNRKTMVEAFPQEIQEIVLILKELSRASDRSGQLELSKYFAALARAESCDDIQLLEERWAAVDLAWVRIPPTCRLMPVHSMESGYEHPFVVSPEFRLDIRTDQSRKEIEERRSGTIAHARALGLSQRLIDCAEDHLRHIDIGVFCSVVRAGVALNFRIAGQAVPNRQDVLAEGGRIFMDAPNNARMTEILRGLFERHATTPGFAQYMTPTLTQIHTIDHELAHPVGRTSESDKAMGLRLMKDLEEGKASLLGILADEWRAGGDPEYRKALITVTIARLFRFMHKSMLENPTSAPYVRENRVAAYTLFEAGVIALTPEGLIIDVENAQSSVWFDALREFNRSVIAAYQSHDVRELDRLTERYCDNGYQPVVDLIAWVNRE